MWFNWTHRRALMLTNGGTDALLAPSVPVSPTLSTRNEGDPLDYD